MAIKKKVQAQGPRVWTVANLGAFYAEHRTELLAHANRVLKDSAKAEEVTQDALIKFMLAAPELESTEHALSYLHRTIENLCIDLFRLEGRRPNLVLLDDATAEVEAAWQADGDHSSAISAAEDAAIIKLALSKLSPAERAALVMWEMEGRSTAEIAAELGIKESDCQYIIDDRPKTLVEFVYDSNWQKETTPARKGFGLFCEYNRALTDVPGIYLAPNWTLLEKYIEEKSDLLGHRITTSISSSI